MGCVSGLYDKVAGLILVYRIVLHVGNRQTVYVGRAVESKMQDIGSTFIMERNALSVFSCWVRSRTDDVAFRIFQRKCPCPAVFAA